MSKAIETDSGSSTPWSVHLARTRDRDFTKRKKSVTPKRRKVRKLKSTENNRQTPEQKTWSSESSEEFLLYHTPKRVQSNYDIISLSGSDSPIFSPRDKKNLKKETDYLTGEPEDALLRDVPVEFLKQLSYGNNNPEKEFGIKKDSVLRTYESPTTKARSLENKTNSKDRRSSMELSDLLFDDYISKNYDKVPKYSKPVSKNDSRDGRPPFKHINALNDNSINKNVKGRKKSIQRIVPNEASLADIIEVPVVKKEPKARMSKRSLHQVVKRGRKSDLSNLRDKTDEYLHPELQDIKFEKGGRDGGRMSFQEFRKVQEEEKHKLNETAPVLKVPTRCSVNDDENSKRLARIVRRFEPNRSVLFNSDSSSRESEKTQEIVTESLTPATRNLVSFVDTDSSPVRKKRILDITSKPCASTNRVEEIETEYMSPRELKRINRIRKYSSRLKMVQRANDLEDTSMKIKREKIQSLAKDSQVESHNTGKSGSKKKPTIKSIKMLAKSQVNKEHEHWRIVL